MRETEPLVHYKQILTFLILTNSILFAQHFPNPKVDSLIIKGIDFIITQHYSDANRIFNKLDENYPLLPFGKIYLAAVSIAKTADYQDSLKVNYIDNYLNKAMDLSERLLDSNESNIWNNYFLALTFAYSAYFEVLKQNYLSAFKEGFQSLQYYKRCAKIDSNFYEVYLAIGIYKYWKSAKLKAISWLPFVKDNRKEGIKLLRSTVNHFTYNKYLAVNSLLWIYIDQKKYGEAVKLSLNALKKYPNSRFFMWGLARAYEGIDKQKAVKIYSKILTSLKKEGKLFPVNSVILKHKIAMLLFDEKHYSDALELINQILSINKISDYNLKKVEERIVRVKKLKEEILEVLASETK